MSLRGPLSAPLLACLLGACSPAADPCGEPLYSGTTDEAWRSLVDAESRVQTGHSNAASITAPTEGQTVDAATPLLLSWSSPIALVPSRVKVKKPFSFFSLLISEAEAHGVPVSGDAYHLRIDIPGQRCPYHVLTTELSHRVTDEGWAKMKSASGPLSAQITSVYFANDRVAEGPFRPADPRTFQLQ